MIEKLINDLNASPSCYHVVSRAENQLKASGFRRLDPAERWTLARGDRAYVTIDGSCLVGFVIGHNEWPSFNIVASHTDSPCFKLKHNPLVAAAKYQKLNIEEYGKSLHYTWFDRPLVVAGRVIVKDRRSGEIRSKLVRDARSYVIPSVAIHLNREANSQLKLNIRKDLAPLAGLSFDAEYVVSLVGDEGLEVCDYDLFVCSGQECFRAGRGEEFLCAPRLDNQTSVFGSVTALCEAAPKNIGVVFLADNEEVGSRTKQGAGATVLRDVLWRINSCLGLGEEEQRMSLANSFMVSCDNSHAIHPNAGELSDDTNKNYLGDGVVIKHHASQSYTTDGVSSAVFKEILKRASVPYQDYYNRSDLPSGGTLGAISSSQLSIRSVDIGLPQLGMHSAVETISIRDYGELIKGLTSFYNTTITTTQDKTRLV